METPLSIFDTTLRDGEQAPGCSMNLEQKLEIAKVLEDLGVNTIEAGFPDTSQEDEIAVQEISDALVRSKVCVFAMPSQASTQKYRQLTTNAPSTQIQLLGSTSDIHL